MPTEQEIAAAKALLEQEGFSVRQPNAADWRLFGCVVTCNMIAPELTEKAFVQTVEKVMAIALGSRQQIERATGKPIIQMGPLHVKSYTRVKAGLARKGVALKLNEE